MTEKIKSLINFLSQNLVTELERDFMFSLTNIFFSSVPSLSSQNPIIESCLRADFGENYVTLKNYG